MEDLKIVVLISGKGSNLKAIAKECSKKNVRAKIISIISNNPNASGLQIKGNFKKKKWPTGLPVCIFGSILVHSVANGVLKGEVIYSPTC